MREDVLNDAEEKLFLALKSFLGVYNLEQKRAIISNNKEILCIAGAGSGKTTVLTKRIEFLIKYRSVDPTKILAITFTRKARQEMINRLSNNGINNEVVVETFNSFCEKILRKYGYELYGKEVRVISYRDKITIIKKALESLNSSFLKAIKIYFTYSQRHGKTDDQLANTFMNDCFFIRDYFKFKNIVIDANFFQTSDNKYKDSAKLVQGVCQFIDNFMRDNGLRDFADQLVDCINLFEKQPEKIPCFKHILIDEYQDVNSSQIKLIDLLKSNKKESDIFAVGDPRQSIYGWRGSDIKYILKFNEKYENCLVINLTKNYRSSQDIVKLINESIKNMNLENLESQIPKSNDIKLLKFRNQDAEFEFVIQKIISSPIRRDEMFILARTNRQLKDLSQLMKARSIKHVIKNDENKTDLIALPGEVTLATVHSVKGLEAQMVIVIGTSSLNFPCNATEHPVIDMVKIDEYNKFEEERRLLYVAMSRAKKSLYLTYSSRKPSLFITKEMLYIIDKKDLKLEVKVKDPVANVIKNLRSWRFEISQELNIPPYMIMHDKTMIEIANRMPLSKRELHDIYGLGPTKIMKYGQEILNIVNG